MPKKPESGGPHRQPDPSQRGVSHDDLDLDHLLAFLLEALEASTQRRNNLERAVERGQMIDNGEIDREQARQKAAIKSIRLVQSFSVTKAEQRLKGIADDHRPSANDGSSACPFQDAISEDDELKRIRNAYKKAVGDVG